ncbi:hypothetical protein LI142_10885 [Eubacterium limosum]|uniref:hypothetical protein n=1 Tax=Eubacterium limosum TaxID=1736 RepID=UPI001D07CB52|nr:hypothetical protein [Eubacterium limosum]MCB6570004.1 hypothetical protein [Eubacterium limosum]
MKNKIELMHQLFGRSKGLCLNCHHLVRVGCHGKAYRKCKVYGVTHGEGTDWKVSNHACGLFPDVFYQGRPIMEIARKMSKNKEIEPINGQISMKGIIE